MTHLGPVTSPDVGGPLTLLVPLGATEQHGPHLPLDTDTRIAVAVAEVAAARHADTVVAPPLPYGSSGEHAGFPGTLSIGQDATTDVLVELVRSAGPEFAAVVFVCGHAGNAEPVQRAVTTLRDESRCASAWFPRVEGGDAHAGHTETSLLLHLAPETVRLDRAHAGATTPVGDLMDDLRRGGVAAVSPNGVLGDPTDATAETGRRIFDALVDDLVHHLDQATR